MGVNGIADMRQDAMSERELQQLKVKVDRFWAMPFKFSDQLILEDREVNILHELLFAAGLDEPTKGTTDG